MKTLVVSLLRLGDFFQQLPLLEQLQDDGRDVHVLVNDSLRGAADLFPDLRFHFFPREGLQAILTDSRTNTLAAVRSLDAFIATLNGHDFDVVENWTHNFLSARLMDLLRAPVKKGARYQDGVLEKDRGGFYLNEIWGPSSAVSFHWVDALALSMGHAFPAVPRADEHRDGCVLLQVLTSDAKKNWSLKNWKDLADWLESEGERVEIPCAPFEKQILLQAGFAEERLRVCDLRELASMLRTAKLLVSGDTSILHLATWTRTPVLGVFLGSANPRKTAPRMQRARVVAGDVACAPCLHRNPCSKPQHLCGEKISLTKIQQEVTQMIRNDPQMIETRSTTLTFEGLQGAVGAFALRENRKDPLTMWSQIVWEFYLNRDHESPVAPYGSAARLLLQHWGGEKGLREWTSELRQRLQASFHHLEEFSEALWIAMRDFNTDEKLSPLSELRMREVALQLASLWRDHDFTTHLTESNLSSDASPFVRLRQRKEALHESYLLFTIQQNLVRVIEQELKERTTDHGARA